MSSSSLASRPSGPAWPFHRALLTDEELQALLWPCDEVADALPTVSGAEAGVRVAAGQCLNGRLS